MGEWHQRPRFENCLKTERVRVYKSLDGAGHAPALSYESAWKQIEHVLGYIPGALYRQAVLEE